jgi:hypothetical protein
MTQYSLPDGSRRSLPIAQARRAWQIWLALAPVAAARGEGVAVSYPTGHPTIEITTVYAPQWESVRVVCLPDGGAVWCSEQEAPDLPGCDFLAAPPPAPWDRCRG